ncbi:MAG: hypothetical protein Q9195_000940 [Heterodermia aff. obscurata]
MPGGEREDYFSEIPEKTLSNGPQSWLDSLPLALDVPPYVTFGSLDVGEPFFRKLTLQVRKHNLYDLPIQIRTAAVENGDAVAAERWAADVYAPHVSLLYADLDIDEEKRQDILQDLDKAEISLRNEGAFQGKENEGYNGWIGGRILLVSTWKVLEKWAVIAERDL